MKARKRLCILRDEDMICVALIPYEFRRLRCIMTAKGQG